MMKFLRSLFSAEPLEVTMRTLLKMIFDELLQRMKMKENIHDKSNYADI